MNEDPFFVEMITSACGANAQQVIWVCREILRHNGTPRGDQLRDALVERFRNGRIPKRAALFLMGFLGLRDKELEQELLGRKA